MEGYKEIGTMMFSDSTSTASTVAQGGATVLAITFFNESFMKMVPFLLVAVVLIIVDLYFGVRAAKHRKETVRFSRALRRTVGKIFEYVCWVSVSATLAVAFDMPSIEWVILAIVMGNELISIISNYFLIHGIKVTGLKETFFGWLGNKANIDTSNLHFEEVPEDVMEENKIDKDINK